MYAMLFVHGIKTFSLVKKIGEGGQEKLNYLNKSTTRVLINNTAVKMTMRS